MTTDHENGRKIVSFVEKHSCIRIYLDDKCDVEAIFVEMQLGFILCLYVVGFNLVLNGFTREWKTVLKKSSFLFVFLREYVCQLLVHTRIVRGLYICIHYIVIRTPRLKILILIDST